MAESGDDLRDELTRRSLVLDGHRLVQAGASAVGENTTALQSRVASSDVIVRKP